MERLWGYHRHAPPFKQIRDRMRERIISIEKDMSIEKPDIALIYVPLHLEGDILDESTPIGRKYVLAKQLEKNQKVINLNEKDKSEAIKSKPKKNNRRSNASAVAKMEKKIS
jgi:hypothetical protein